MPRNDTNRCNAQFFFQLGPRSILHDCRASLGEPQILDPSVLVRDGVTSKSRMQTPNPSPQILWALADTTRPHKANHRNYNVLEANGCFTTSSKDRPQETSVHKHVNSTANAKVKPVVRERNWPTLQPAVSIQLFVQHVFVVLTSAGAGASTILCSNNRHRICGNRRT